VSHKSNPSELLEKFSEIKSLCTKYNNKFLKYYEGLQIIVIHVQLVTFYSL